MSNNQPQQPTDEELLIVAVNGVDTSIYGTNKSIRISERNTDEENGAENGSKARHLPFFEIVAILSTAFAYGCVMTTLFLITLPVECKRIQYEHATVQKSISLAIFVAIAGVTQLVTPLCGILSDTYQPPIQWDVGQRLPYLVLGAILTVIGILGQGLSSMWSFWIRYSVSFFLHMIGLNIVYSMMITLIPDHVPESQTGTANGTLALLLVTGSLFGFGIFHSVLGEDVFSMYGLYTCIVVGTTVLTCSYAHDRDVVLGKKRSYKRHGTPAARAHGRGLNRIPNPALLLKTMLVDPLGEMDWKTLSKSYTIDRSKHHGFFVITLSRTFYYMGISVQTFFLFYIHDIIQVKDNPEAAVAVLAILGQCAGAITCYPLGIASDKCFHGRRKPFVCVACAILAAATLSMIFLTNMHQMMIASSVLGAANGMYLTMDTSLAVDNLPSEHDDDEGTSESAQLLGVWGVAGFVGSALGPLVGGPLLYTFGSPTLALDGEVEYSIQGYGCVLSMSALYFFVSALIVLRFIRNENVNT